MALLGARYGLERGLVMSLEVHINHNALITDPVPDKMSTKCLPPVIIDQKMVEKLLQQAFNSPLR